MVAPIGSIQPLRPQSTLSTDGVARKPAVGAGSFENMVSRTVRTLEGLQGQADAAALDFVSGGSTELHDAMISMEQASLGFQLTLAMRNKAVEAYQEIMRMQV